MKAKILKCINICKNFCEENLCLYVLKKSSSTTASCCSNTFYVPHPLDRPLLHLMLLLPTCPTTSYQHKKVLYPKMCTRLS